LDSGLLFFLDGLADDVCHVSIAFFLLLDEGGVVEALIHLDLFLFASRSRAFGCCRLLALLFGLGVFQRNGAGFTGAAGSARAREGVGATIGTTLPV